MATNKTYIVDATEQIMGRMCTQVAKLAMYGEKIVIINAKDAVISGNKKNIFAKYVHLRHIRTNTNPKAGPFAHSRPDTFLRQKVRFMLPKNIRGRDALHRVHVYIGGIPEQKMKSYHNQETMVLRKSHSDQLWGKYVYISQVCMNMGWTGKSREYMGE